MMCRMVSLGFFVVLICCLFVGIEAEKVSAQDGVIVNAIPVPDPFPWTMYLPAITGQGGAESVWRVVTNVTCPTPLTFTVTVEGMIQNSEMSPLDFQGNYSEWASTPPGTKNVSWQAICSSYPPGWSGSFNHTFEDQMNYVFILNDGGNGQPVVNVLEGQGIPAGARVVQ